MEGLRESIRIFPYLRGKPAIRARNGKKSCEENFSGEVLASPSPLGARKGDSVERVVVSVRNYESLRRFSEKVFEWKIKGFPRNEMIQAFSYIESLPQNSSKIILS